MSSHDAPLLSPEKLQMPSVAASLERAELEEMAFTDPLTGIFNRNASKSLFLELEEQATPFGVLNADLNNFGEINKKFGHLIGDRVLKYSAWFLRDEIRAEGDGVAVRSGGDEFAIFALLKAKERGVITDGEEQRQALEAMSGRIQVKYRESNVVQTINEAIGYDAPLGISIGTAIWEPGMSHDDLLAAADTKGPTQDEPTEQLHIPAIDEILKYSIGE